MQQLFGGWALPRPAATAYSLSIPSLGKSMMGRNGGKG